MRDRLLPIIAGLQEIVTDIAMSLDPLTPAENEARQLVAQALDRCKLARAKLNQSDVKKGMK